ncbi:DNA-processing protein DprA [Carboxydochorda subterranea]|uniref:DNA-processing protein DprA n=1 Tax=Carboxydichorda subterranea TaxID=3109565 RepID=A0ABZ1C0G9_9FIRM|nr:DNA-processing protein DprA [Limnochorda sp. L945t]WRP18439.1 DNA-processing protein DprA [Limnochorda sp. L945t]
MGRPDPFAPGVYAGALMELPGVGPAAVRWAVERFGSPRAAWEADAEAWSADPLLSGTARASLRSRRDPRALDRLARALERCRARAITPWDDAGARQAWHLPIYPSNLLALPDPPVVLYVRGSLWPDDRVAVAVVGSRNADVSGLMAAEKLAAGLAEWGFTIVSGLATGIDGAAHQAALRVKGRTVAVLGCGIDRVYPREHERLARQVEAAGALVSEYPPGTPVDRWRLARRNYVIAGLSLGVVVVEARARSGALSTAEMADALSRAVLVTPGDITRSTTVGSNRLLADGATPCTQPGDVAVHALDTLKLLEGPQALERLAAAGGPATTGGPEGRWGRLLDRLAERDAPSRPPSPAELAPALRAVWDVLSKGPMDVDELSYRADLAVQPLLARLTELEAGGYVRRLMDGRWARRRLG